MNTETKIRKYILEQYPNEACGVICGDEFIPVTNISETPEQHFKMDPVELLKIQQKHKIDFIIHSHTYTSERKPLFDLDPCTPSHSDYINQQKHNIPWKIYATEGENVTQPVIFPQSQDTPLIGRDFIFYVNDCYSLIRDFYYQNLNITLKPHPTDWTWEEGATTNCYEQFFSEFGFEKVSMDDLQYGDLIVMSIMGDCNHAGVYIGDSMMMHHMVRRKSDKIMVGRMESFIDFAMRYKNVTQC